MNFKNILINLLPNFPNKRFGIYSGTNTKEEWWLMANSLSNFKKEYENKDYILKFEQNFAKKCNTKYALSFGAGRMALYSILRALNIGDGDEIILPAFTCVVVPNAILYSKAKPVYLDINPVNFNINVDLIESAITKKTKAIYAQHTFGIPCDIERIKKIAHKHNLIVIEDGAHALGMSYKNQKCGELGDVAFFSIDHSKVINTHLGGMAVTNNESIYKSLLKLKKETISLEKKDVKKITISFLIENILLSPYVLWIGKSIHAILTYFKFLFFFKDELILNKPSYYPCDLNPILSKLGSSQLKNFDNNLNHRINIAKFLEEKIKWYKFSQEDINNFAWLRYSFVVRDRKKFIKKFSKIFNLDIWYDSIFAGREKNFEDVKYIKGSCPVAEFVAKKIVNLPTHLGIPMTVIKKTIDKNWLWLEKEIYYNYLQDIK